MHCKVMETNRQVLLAPFDYLVDGSVTEILPVVSRKCLHGPYLQRLQYIVFHFEA
jgi:hypothetical protein